MPKMLQLVGKTFGRLAVLAAAETPEGKKGSHWLCVCRCGSNKVVRGAELTFGLVTACGPACKDRLLPGRRDPAYGSWWGMRRRCSEPTHISYANYGGRGISICERWMKFDNFFEDMGPRPIGMTLERKDRNGNYEPGNCVWATKHVQNSNKSTNKIVEVSGVSGTVSDVAQALGKNRMRVYKRLSTGHSLDVAFSDQKLIGGPAKKSHCKYGHALTPDNLYWYGKNQRACRTCALKRASERKRAIRNAREHKAA